LLRLTATAGALGVLGPGTRTFGIYYDDPSVTPVDALRSEACVTVSDDWAPSGELQRLEIRGGRYAVVLHVGPYAERSRTWLYGTWLAQSGEEAADAPCVENYLNDARTVGGQPQNRDLVTAPRPLTLTLTLPFALCPLTLKTFDQSGFSKQRATGPSLPRECSVLRTFERQMLLLVSPRNRSLELARGSGCTDYEHHASIQAGSRR
jgi:DNA gyrase inhibitor GyrI